MTKLIVLKFKISFEIITPILFRRSPTDNIMSYKVQSSKKILGFSFINITKNNEQSRALRFLQTNLRT